MITLVLGAGDLASGVITRLYRAGLRVVATELPQPFAVRRLVSFSEAVYAGETNVEGILARRVMDPEDTLRILQILSKRQVPILVDPQGASVRALHPTVVVDARMTKQKAELLPKSIGLIIGLGPGFIAGENCHAVIETNRGHMLGRVIWKGAPEPNTKIPDNVAGRRDERVLRSPLDGILTLMVAIGDHLEEGQPVAEVDGQVINAPFKGVIRGLLPSGFHVRKGLKVGDVDPRDDPRYCTLVSDKSLAVGGGVLEAILSRVELRKNLWG